MLDMKSFLKIDSGKVFDRGEIIDCPEGLHMARTGRMLKWVAVKGYADDWCVYTHFADNDWDFIRRSGDKVTGKENIQKVVPCDEDVFSCYRY